MFGRHFLILEAVHSVAMEHPDGCDCLTCRAAAGDPVALGEVYRQMEEIDG